MAEEDPETYRRRMKSMHDNMEAKAREGHTARPNQGVNERLHEIQQKRQRADHEYQRRKSTSGSGQPESSGSCALVLALAASVPILATFGLLQFV